MSEVKVNKISPRSGTTVTLGDSGDTFTIPSGATINNQGTAVNFGATGSASWVTTVKTNSDSGFTAVAGEGYFLNTTAGTISVNLPAGSAGAVVAFKDYAGTFDTNVATLVPNGSDKIGGVASNATLSTEGIAVTLVFIDSTQGWLVTDSGLQDEAPGPQFIVATGGTITTVCTNFKVHTFTGPGTFTVCSVGNAAGSTEISYMVVAGGGGGAGTANPSTSDAGGGGGAGGYREGKTPQCTYTSSPITCTSGSNNGLPVTATGYPVTVGGGGGGGGIASPGSTGNNSVFAGTTTITSAGGGVGRHNGGAGNRTGTNGGSGGGPSGGGTGMSGGLGNTPPTTPAQGFPGSTHCESPDGYGGAGGGATATGSDSPGPTNAGAGGAGATSSINGTPTARAGGGGGGGNSSMVGGPGGTGGGGAGGNGGGTGVTGTTNTGGGGGGGGGNNGPGGGAGGSGIVVIRYKFQ